MANEYYASFEINCGELKDCKVYPQTVYVVKSFKSKPETCYLDAMFIARQLSEEYMSNPETKKTEVKLIGVSSHNYFMSYLFYKKSNVECSQLEHLLNKHMTKTELKKNMNSKSKVICS